MRLSVYNVQQEPHRQVGHISLENGQLTFAPFSAADEPYRGPIEQFLKGLGNEILMRTDYNATRNGTMRTHSDYGKSVGPDEPDLYLQGVSQKLKHYSVDNMVLYAEPVE
jgi:hypothetical protein